MAGICSVFGCGAVKDGNTSLHLLPKDPTTRETWIRLLRLKKIISPKTQVCSNHFTEDSFENLTRKHMGFDTKLMLKHDAVPRAGPPGFATASWSGVAATTRSVSCQTDEVVTTAVAIQCDDLVRDTVGTQLSEGTLKSRRSRGVQSKPSTSVVSVGTEGTEPPPQQQQHPFGLMSTPVKVAQPPPVPDWSLAETEVDEQLNMDRDDDSSYVPSFSAMEESSIAESPQIPLKDVPKYIVYESCLLELFSLCPSCNHKCTVKKFVRGTCLSVKQNCTACHLTREWCSQPKVRSMAVGNLHLSAAIAFTGASFREVQKVLNALKVRAISETAHYKNVSTYLNPCIYTTWKTQQAELLHSLSQQEEVVLGGDMRADSPGHCAKYGSYTMMDMQSGKVVDIQLVQSNEVGGSTHMEKEGLIRSLNLLESSGVKISSIVSDRHLQIQKFLREQKPEIKHFYDVWHVAKGLSKKLEALSKERDCDKLKKWQQSIINHMYWAATTSATGQETVAKWASLTNHVQDVHTHSNVLFPQCQHAALTSGQSSKWFKPGTKVIGKLEKILQNTRLLKDIEKLSHNHQTSAIEGFHSLILKFAPKSLVFSYHGMLCRLCLAALHFNENSQREQLRTQKGKKVYKIRFPKRKKGMYSVYAVKKRPTYQYVDELLDSLFTERLLNPEPVAAELAMVPVPPPLCATFERPNKDEAIAGFVSRFNLTPASQIN